MSKLTIVLLVILVVLIIATVVLYFLGKKMEKRQAEQQEQMEATKQNMSMLVIDKKKMKLRDACLCDGKRTKIYASFQGLCCKGKGRTEDYFFHVRQRSLRCHSGQERSQSNRKWYLHFRCTRCERFSGYSAGEKRLLLQI